MPHSPRLLSAIALLWVAALLPLAGCDPVASSLSGQDALASSISRRKAAAFEERLARYEAAGLERRRAQVAAETPPALAGIGAALKIEDGKVLVDKIIPDMPAAASGAIGPGDQIVSVAQADGEPVDVAGLGLKQVVDLIVGPANTFVQLKIIAAGKEATQFRVVSFRRRAMQGLALCLRGDLEHEKFLSAGTPAPELAMSRLIGGEPANLAQFAGRVVILEFWSTGCRPCLQTLDVLQSLHAEHPGWSCQIELVGINVDDVVAEAADFAKDRADRWPNVDLVWAGPDAASAYRIAALPTVYVIDREGNVVAAGHDLDLPAVLEPLLDRSAVAPPPASDSGP